MVPALLKAVVALASVLLVGFTLYSAYFGVFPDGIQRSVHLVLVFVLVFTISLQATFAEEGARFVFLKRAWAVVALCLGVIAAGHQLVNFEAINNRYGAITPGEVLLGVGLVIALFDACRRTIGLSIVVLAALFVLYGLFGAYLPSPFGHRGYSLERVASQVYLGGGGVFGTPLGVSATFVTSVVVLGALLEKTGAGQVLMDFATAMTGRMRGGPAKAAVVGSSLMGMISGTAVANVLTTGPISIPLMRRSGYRTQVTCGAGSLDRNVAQACLEASVGGLEFLVGIPGTIGGALRMNAGSFGYEMNDVVASVEAIDGGGALQTLSIGDMGFSYRHCSVPESWTFLSAKLRGQSGKKEDIHAKMLEIQSDREENQPVRTRTGGSTFANPQGHRAWKLIDKAGCRGLQQGGAMVSEKHCNFLVNTGSASADDIETLGEEVRRRVLDTTGIELEWEIRRIGIPAQNGQSLSASILEEGRA